MAIAHSFIQPTVQLTRHGLKNLKERAGIPKRAAQRHIGLVLDRGIRLYQHKNRRWRKWADWARQHYHADIFYHYGNCIYAFKRPEDKHYVLITVLHLPHSGAWEN